MQSSSRGSQNRTVSPRSRAAPSHGSTLPWWSSPVRTISSPGAIVAAIDRLTWNVSVVMFGAELDLVGVGRAEHVGHRLVGLVRRSRRSGGS